MAGSHKSVAMSIVRFIVGIIAFVSVFVLFIWLTSSGEATHNLNDNLGSHIGAYRLSYMNEEELSLLRPSVEKRLEELNAEIENMLLDRKVLLENSSNVTDAIKADQLIDGFREIDHRIDKLRENLLKFCGAAKFWEIIPPDHECK